MKLEDIFNAPLIKAMAKELKREAETATPTPYEKELQKIKEREEKGEE